MAPKRVRFHTRGAKAGSLSQGPSFFPPGEGGDGQGSWTLSNQPGCHGNLVTMATSPLRAGYHGNQLRNDWLSRPVARADLIYDDVSMVINVCILIIYIYISYIIL